MTQKNYDRIRAVLYARKWAFSRNPAYFSSNQIGGDCTNFVSQCLYAGSGVMNFTPVFGWFYRSANDRTASWTGVEYLYNFLISNLGDGPVAVETELSQIRHGDVIQLGRETGDFYHSCLVVGFRRGIPLVASHSLDAYNKPLTNYRFERIRYLHITGVNVPQSN